MALCTLAGFTLREADDVRRAMGKKNIDQLRDYKPKFVEGMVAAGMDADYGESLWIVLAGDEDSDNNGFADYCLVGSTLINTLYGLIPIEEIVRGRYQLEVLTQGPQELEYKKVTQWFDHGLKEVYTYELSNGSTITCTPDHKFMTTDGQMVTIEIALAEDLELMEHSNE